MKTVRVENVRPGPGGAVWLHTPGHCVSSCGPIIVNELGIAPGWAGTLYAVPDGEGLPADAREKLRTLRNKVGGWFHANSQAPSGFRYVVTDLDAILARLPAAAAAPPVAADVVEGRTVEVGVREIPGSPDTRALVFLSEMCDPPRYFAAKTVALLLGSDAPGRYRFPIPERLPDPPEPEPERGLLVFATPSAVRGHCPFCWYKNFRREKHCRNKQCGAEFTGEIIVADALRPEVTGDLPAPEPKPERVRPWLVPQADKKFFPYICPECGGATRERNDTPTLHSDSCSLRAVEWGEPRVLSAAETPAGATSNG